MINSAADYNSNARDKIVINPVYIKKKPDKLKKIRNKMSKNDFCYSYGIYIVMAVLSTALIALNIILYYNVSKQVSKLRVMILSKNETDTTAEKILKNEIVLIREEIKENLKSLENKIETSVNGIEKKLDGSLQNFKNETRKELVGNLKGTTSEISESANQIRKDMNSNMKFLFSLPFGIHNNVPISRFYGWFYAYNKPYNHKTTSTEIDAIINSCLPTTILCLGGVDNTNNVLRVVSCGFCSVVLSKTPKNTPTLHNGAYWYYSPDVENSRSMGFAPNSSIKQENADIVDIFNNQRVSWQLNEISGGWRLGSLIDLDNSTDYNKTMIKKDL
jgi:hypothetical protein